MVRFDISGHPRVVLTVWPSYRTRHTEPEDPTVTPPSEPARLKLYDEARTVFSEQAADTLMESLPPLPFADLATKADLHATKADLEHQIENLRSELQVGLAGLRTELKDEMHTGFARVDANLRTQLYWMIGTMITLFGVLAALMVTGA